MVLFITQAKAKLLIKGNLFISLLNCLFKGAGIVMKQNK